MNLRGTLIPGLVPNVYGIDDAAEASRRFDEGSLGYSVVVWTAIDLDEASE